MRLKLTRRHALKMKVQTRIAAQLVGGSGLSITYFEGEMLS
jgi:hypothetical protein